MGAILEYPRHEPVGRLETEGSRRETERRLATKKNFLFEPTPLGDGEFEVFPQAEAQSRPSG